MGKKILSLFSIITIAVMLLSASAAPRASVRGVEDMPIFQGTKFDAHYRAPNEGAVQAMLEEQLVVLPGSGPEVMAQGVTNFMKHFHWHNPDVSNPFKLQELLDFENWKAKPVETDRSIKSLVALMEFPDTPYTWTSHTNAAGECVDTEVTFQGPLHNQMEPPGPRDNNTIYYNDTNPALYEEIYFGEGPNAGVTANHPNLGDIFFKGKTMVNYYLEQSRGKFAPSGEVYPKWLLAKYPEAYYGEDGCSGSHNIRAKDLVLEALELLKTEGIDWQDFDGTGDGVVDNFTVIHAGAGQEGGGGAQGNFAIWSHASMVGGMEGVLVCTKGETGCPDRDIRVLDYSMDPEMVDLGVIAEEFGHAAFGLPDIYTTDYQASPSNWAIMEAGAWNGKLGGMEPAPFPLFFRYIVGWAKPKEIAYDAKPTATLVGQLSKTPKGLWEGMKINLPDKEVPIDNPLGSGQAIWSNVGNVLNNTIQTEVDLTGAAAPLLTLASYWSIEEDWDYGYVEVSTDSGATWIMLDDVGDYFTTTDPNAQNDGVALTGEGQGTLSFDLSAYAGQVALIRFRYWTDVAAQGAGWWIDDVSLTDGATVLFSDDFEAGLGNWTSDGWLLVPLTQTYPRYYLVEWRNNSGYDQGLKYPYATVYSDDDEWEVDRGPYTVPGMLLWFRDASYPFDYALGDAWYDPPSIGAKHALLVVDSHYFPYTWDDWYYASGANLRLNSRLQPGNATFTLQKTTPFKIRLGFDPATGLYVDTPLDEQTFGPLPAVSQFHDSLGYYPGLWYRPSTGSLYFWDSQSSAVIPAQGDYTTRITWLDQTPATDLYGIDIGPTILGTGNPGDAGVQFGLHIAVSAKSHDGSWGLIQTWNSEALTEVTLKVNKSTVEPGKTLMYQIKLKSLSPAMQKVVVDCPIPAGTTLNYGRPYDAETKSIHWEGWLPPMHPKVLTFTVKVDAGLATGTEIKGSVTVSDDALGSAAEVVTTVK